MSFRKLGIVLFLGLLISACNLPRAASPTPFLFPTPDLTLTAIYSPLQTQLASTPAAPTATLQPGVPTPTPTLISVITNVPPATGATATATPPAPTLVPPTRTSVPPTPMPTQVEEARIRADFLNTPPTIDGNLSDWSLTSTPVQNVVFGADNRQSNADLSGSVMVGWTTDALYLAGHVRDDKYVQNAHGSNLYLGDSLEILFDRDLAGDQTNHNLTGDDYQLGISPGSPGPGDNPEAYLWYPQRDAGKVTDIDSAFVPTDKGYDFEMKIPWSVFGATITGGERFGFGFSISDNDRANANVQQSMVSNVNTRLLVDPTTWGLLRVVKP